MVPSHLTDDELKALLQGQSRDEEEREAGNLQEERSSLAAALSNHKRLGLVVFNLLRDFKRGRYSHLQWSKAVYRTILSPEGLRKKNRPVPTCQFGLWIEAHQGAIEAFSPEILRTMGVLHQALHKMGGPHSFSRRGSRILRNRFLDEFHDKTVALLDVINDLDKKMTVHMAYRDPLTEVYNQEMVAPLLRTELNRIKRGGHSSSIALLNVASHPGSSSSEPLEDNLLLSEVASFLVRATRPYDFILRVEKMDFLCIFPETNIKMVMPIVERLRDGVRSVDQDHPGSPPLVNMTVGISPLSPDIAVGKNLQRADTALEMARQKGEGSVCVLDENEITHIVAGPEKQA